MTQNLNSSTAFLLASAFFRYCFSGFDLTRMKSSQIDYMKSVSCNLGHYVLDKAKDGPFKFNLKDETDYNWHGYMVILESVLRP